MTTLTAHSLTDMTQWDLSEIDDGDVTHHTATRWEVVNSGTFADFTFKGTGFTYPSGGDTPNGGTIHSFSVGNGGHTFDDVVGDISAQTFVHFIHTHNTVGLLRTWFSGNDTFNGSAGDDHLLGFAGKDTFNLQDGGEDTAEGGDGNDVFNMGAAFDGSDHVLGGDGDDTVALKGHYHQMLGGDSLNSVETILLKPGFSYDLAIDNPAIGSGGLVVDGRALKSGNVMDISFDNGPRGVTILGGGGGDTLFGTNRGDTFTGGNGNDFLTGFGAADRLTGGRGNDLFVFHAVSESASTHYDTIADFHVGDDRIELDFAVSGVHTPVHGALSSGNFDAGLANAIGNSELAKDGAVLFVADTGNLAGSTFLIIDGNGHAGYQAGKDYVVLLEDTHHLSGFNLSSFVQIA